MNQIHKCKACGNIIPEDSKTFLCSECEAAVIQQHFMNWKLENFGYNPTIDDVIEHLYKLQHIGNI
jgi:hypothetical protein